MAPNDALPCFKKRWKIPIRPSWPTPWRQKTDGDGFDDLRQDGNPHAQIDGVHRIEEETDLMSHQPGHTTADNWCWPKSVSSTSPRWNGSLAMMYVVTWCILMPHVTQCLTINPRWNRGYSGPDLIPTGLRLPRKVPERKRQAGTAFGPAHSWKIGAISDLILSVSRKQKHSKPPITIGWGYIYLILYSAQKKLKPCQNLSKRRLSN